MKIIEGLPFFDYPRAVPLPFGDSTQVSAFQMVLWMSLVPKGSLCPPNAIRFPVILDSNLANFTMRIQHFSSWATRAVGIVHRYGTEVIEGQLVDLLSCNLWLYPNLPGSADEIISGLPPHRIELDGGVRVYQQGNAGPHLPTLGLPAMAVAGLIVRIDGVSRSVDVET